MRTFLVHLFFIASICPVWSQSNPPHNKLDLNGDGILNEWRVIGPFDNPTHPDKPWQQMGHGIDQLESLGGSQQFSGAPLETLRSIDPNLQSFVHSVNKIAHPGLFDLSQTPIAGEGRVAFAYCSFELQEEQDLYAALGSDDQITIWLNGEKVYSLDQGRPCSEWQNTFPAKGRPGKNFILVKLVNNVSGWEFILRLIICCPDVIHELLSNHLDRCTNVIQTRVQSGSRQC